MKILFRQPYLHVRLETRRSSPKKKIELLKNLLGSIILHGPRTPRVISQKLKESSEGKELLLSFGIDALVNRAKYERRLLVSAAI